MYIKIKMYYIFIYLFIFEIFSAPLFSNFFPFVSNYAELAINHSLFRLESNQSFFI